MGHAALVIAGCWVDLGLVLRHRSLGELLLMDITWDWDGSGGLISWSWPSHLGGLGPTPGWNTKTLSATTLRRKEREKQKQEQNNGQTELYDKW